MNKEKIKLIFVGEGAVGKTSLISQFIDQKFNEEYLATIGRDKSIKDIVIDNKNIKLEIWDTPGQEKYNHVNKIFMKNSKIALIVYSITDQQSFEKLNKWINVVKEVNKNEEIIFGIAANKSDLFENQVISKEEGEKFAKDNGILFFETSAKDYKSIEKVFTELTKTYLKMIEEKHKNNHQSKNNPNLNNNNTKIESFENDYVSLNEIESKDNGNDCSSKCFII